MVGRENSFFKPIHFILIFSSFDVAALAVQAFGGAGAAQAQAQGTDPAASTRIIVCLLFEPCVNLLGNRD